MSADRSKLKLDEQSFETLLAAAYTVQEHTAKQKRVSGGQGTCSQCGGVLEPEHQFCGHCGARREEYRPGERMQSKLASLWMMSQKKNGAPEFAGAPPDADLTAQSLDSGTVDLAIEPSEPLWEDTSLGKGEEITAEGNDLHLHSLLLPSDDESAGALTSTELEPEPRWNLRLVLRFHRADLYLAVAILVAALALSWVIWGTSLTPAAPKGAQLSVGERTLVKLGIAEAPDRPTVYRGNPSTRVWEDPHTALYYCDGAEQFGTTRGGHFSTQREAQMDRFSPAARTPCE